MAYYLAVRSEFCEVAYRNDPTSLQPGA